MLPKKTIQNIRQLHLKKFRDEQQLFIVEGDKSCLELLKSSIVTREVFATAAWIESHIEELKNVNYYQVNEKEMERISCLTTPQQVLAVAECPIFHLNDLDMTQPLLVLDTLRNPGNLGTIIRAADWFGFRQILCTETCVEFTNPKTIQASMGSFTRVKIAYANPIPYLAEAKERQIFGMAMEGEPLPKLSFGDNDIFVIGSESHGISPEINALIETHLHIPNYTNTQDKAESLNVSIAASVMMYDFCAKKEGGKVFL